MNLINQKKLIEVQANFQRQALANAVKSGFENGYAFGCIDGRIATLKDVLTALADSPPEVIKVFSDEIAKWEEEKKKILAKAQEPR